MNILREGKSRGNIKSYPGHNGPPPPVPPPPPPPNPPARRRYVPLNPSMGRETHEYRVTVNDGAGMIFTTTWYIECHGRDVHASLRAAYPDAGVILQRRRMVGDVENV